MDPHKNGNGKWIGKIKAEGEDLYDIALFGNGNSFQKDPGLKVPLPIEEGHE